MLVSPLTATIYLPLLPLLATHFEVSGQAINLTTTLYIISQARPPAIFSLFQILWAAGHSTGLHMHSIP